MSCSFSFHLSGRFAQPLELLSRQASRFAEQFRKLRWLFMNDLRQVLGHAARLMGDYAEARAQYYRAAVILAEMNNSWGLFYLLVAFACLAAAEAQWERAARLFGAVERLGATIGAPMVPIERTECERDTAAARVALGEPAFAAAWTAGQALSLEETIAYALA